MWVKERKGKRKEMEKNHHLLKACHKSGSVNLVILFNPQNYLSIYYLYFVDKETELFP